ncbi:autotransporter domain-containing protein [Pseudomonas gessardii]|uniref:Autotransporter domain-containing protein n=1 Tax=Pseudomonas gessardii TaxID=78544 RepID=A0ABS9F7N3_9PSED|nr:autotransporter outer membrane beta-barrel domain-containing protein [Pseudomonas gessardii]MCF4979661.1 autotransporter domain-containing protein [Pseudomonas gessardii]MCF4990750.1 autotransporter domain-containing protein [Pseudomonas gessardii]MCF5084547.1 autotransporter domain-containing protein [Pseudomonas gessardii]MCF5093769.1 autotransporter domain-containing protein [Pseudomonas gessardii]MCF5107302.1 autotransporter domain-containing protein [Pseudomonas gessardii]
MPRTSKRLALVITFTLSLFSIQLAVARGDMEPPSDHDPAYPEPATPFYFVDYATTGNGRSVALVLDRAVDALLESDNLSVREQYLIADDARYMGNLAPGRVGAVLEQLAASQNANLGSATHNSLKPVQASLLSAMGDVNSDAAGRFWLQGLGNAGSLDGQHGAADLQQRTQGLVLGADWAVDHAWRAGVMGAKTTSDLSAKRFKAALDSWHLGAYAVRQDGPLALRLGAIYSNHAGLNKRSVDFDFIDYREQLKGKYTAQSQNIFSELGYRVDSGSFAAEPFAGVGFQRYHRERFKEKGGLSALNVGEQTQQNLSSTLGLRLSSLYTLDNQMTLKPHLSASWKHLYGNVGSRVRQSSAWVDRSVFNSDFTIEGTALDRNSLALQAGLGLGMSTTQSVGLTYTGDFGARSSNQAVMGQWTLAF